MQALTDAEVKQLEKKANEIRATIVEMLVTEIGRAHV